MRRFGWRWWCLRQGSPGETKRHKRGTAQKKQTPARDRHDNPHTPRKQPVTQHQRVTAKLNRAGHRRDSREREARPIPDRCQAMGGARAANRARWGSEKSNVTAVLVAKRPETCGSGKDGGSAVSAPARWISVQIGQRSSARCSGFVGSAGAVRTSFDAFALPSANLPAECGVKLSRCTCPKVRASWKASANSARYEPHLDRDRNQCIVVALARLTGCSGPSDSTLATLVIV